MTKVINKIDELEIPNYETRLGSYLDEDSFMDYLLLLLEDKTKWILGGSSKYMQYISYEKKDGTLISLHLDHCGEYKIAVAVELKTNKKIQRIVDLEEDKTNTDLVRNRYNKRKFKKIVIAYRIVEDYLCELKEGKIRYRIKKLFGR